MTDITSMSQFGLIAPQYLLALVAIPALLIFMLVISRRRGRYVVSYTNIEVLAEVIERRRIWRRWVPLILLVLALASAATALARPRAHLVVPDQNATVILLVNVSGSMRATDVAPTRMTAAVNSMRLFLAQLPKQFRVGLVAFSSEPEVLDAPTKDREAIENGLNFLSPQAGTAIGDGLGTAVRLAVTSLTELGVTKKEGEYLPALIVLESDGQQNRGVLQPLDAAKIAKTAGIRVYGVSLGTNKGKVRFDIGTDSVAVPVPPDPQTVREISRVTGGEAFTVSKAESLEVVYKNLGSSIGRKTVIREITSWFAVLTALLLIAGVGLARAWGASLP